MPTEQDPRARRAARLKLLAILAVCAAPVIASYFTYYVLRPEGRTNYGDLVEPQRSVDALPVAALDGAPASLAALRGKWVMLTIDVAACERACADKLYAMRQVRLTTGKERERVERVLLVTDDGMPSAALLAEHAGMVALRVAHDAAQRLFPAAPGGRPADHVYVIDPAGRLMMRFPRDADPSRMKKDIAKLLRASRVG